VRGLNDGLGLGGGVDVRHHDAVRTPVEHAGDKISMRSADAHDPLGAAASQSP
jgi:hypothetical protein